MIWFGKQLNEVMWTPPAGVNPIGDENTRMEHALRWVAARDPHLEGEALLDALGATGWVDRGTAARLLPCFRAFDPDRYFAEALRSLSFRGPTAAGEFRQRIGRVMEDMTGTAALGSVGPEECVRFGDGQRQGVVLAYPQVQFTVGGEAVKAVAAAVDEMPDALVIVARNFQENTAGQLRALLQGSEVPGTLITVNLLLGMRASALRYQPGPDRVLQLLGAGRPLRSRDIAVLGDRRN
ncbi:MAG TPA: hypothetical protein VF665_25665 [Longimicrobium sp.]|jgi:hypothetical protein|uniref:hypothetical protein n=1 Tax=Longimicrobium sp. TaxID=2029185 RepID=UPI002EDA985E